MSEFIKCFNIKRMSDLKTLYDNIDETIKSGRTLIFCRELLKTYCSDDWKKYVNFYPDKYTRVILAEYSNNNFEFILICWNKDQLSPIHDHPNNGCLVKVLQGSLIEDIYVKHDTGHYLYVASRTSDVGNISYMEKDEVIHRIKNNNKNPTELSQSVSLHIYSPPKFKLKLFNEKNIL